MAMYSRAVSGISRKLSIFEVRIAAIRSAALLNFRRTPYVIRSKPDVTRMNRCD